MVRIWRELGWRRSAIVVAMLVLVARVAMAEGIGPGQESADLTAYLAAHAGDRSQSTDVAKAFARLARLEDEQKHTEALNALYKRVRTWFEQHNLEKNGGPEAAIAAEANRRLLDLPVAVAMDVQVRSTPGLAPDAAIAERTAELDGLLTQLIGSRPAGSPPDAARVGGLVGELDGVRAFAALPQTRLAAQSVAQIVERAAQSLGKLPIPEGLTAEAQTAQQTAVRQAVLALEARAFASVEAAWLAGPDKKDAVAMGLRRTLNRLKPLKYPQLEEEANDTLAVTPEQAEASRMASLAQKAEKCKLRVMYLQKAVKLDPQNPRYLELLQVAQGGCQ